MGGPGYGQGYGRAPGGAGGYGPGYGMGPGMMGGYGPGYGMGPGMMGGYGPGYGMGPWMMGGYGGGYGYGMGPGMMGGYGGYGYNPLNLSDAQRTKIQKIQEDAARSQWEIMNKMHEAISQGWQDAQKKIDAVLTKEQRDRLQRGWRGR
jgi:Spy/CpxP family protein refolding chaperone